MFVIDLSKVLMYERCCYYTKNRYGNNSRILFTDADSLMYGIKMIMFMKILARAKKCLISVIIQLSQNIMMIIKDVIKEFVRFKSKMSSFLVDDSGEHKKAKGLNKNIVTAVSHNEYKDVLLNNKCLRHSMNRIQSKNHSVGTYEINKVSLSCFVDKIHIINNGYDELALGY